MVAGMELIGQRHALFPDLEARVYWAFAAIVPLALPVRVAVEAWLLRLAREGMPAFGAALEAREQLRSELAGLLGGEASSYGFVQGTTAGMVALAHSINWRSGDRVVIFDDEFPANTVPWREAARVYRLGVDVLPLATFASTPELGLASLEASLRRGGSRLVTVSAVEFQTGLALPLRDIADVCHRYGALLAVDAIQAAGIVPLDLPTLGVDLAVGGGHKWLLAMDGAGWVYVAPAAREQLGTAMAGWLSFEGGPRFLFEPGHLHDRREHVAAPRVFEGGSSSTAAVVALLEGVKLCRQVTPAVAFAHVQALHDRVEPRLVELGFVSERTSFAAGRSGILAARPPAGVSLAALQRSLAQRGVVVTIPDGRLRLAPHFMSTFKEAEMLVAALPEALSEVATPG